MLINNNFQKNKYNNQEKNTQIKKITIIRGFKCRLIKKLKKIKLLMTRDCLNQHKKINQIHK